LYGIGRGLLRSVPSFDSFILRPLSKTYNVKILYINRNIGIISNKRSSEYGKIPSIPICSFKNNIFANLDNDKEYFQDEIFSYSKKFYDLHGDHYVSNRNLIDQLSMINQIKKYIDPSLYKYAILMRDDLLFTKFHPTIDIVISKIDKYVHIPAWFWWHGYNDRFCIFSTDKLSHITSRVSLIPSFLEEYGFLNSELLMLYCLEKSGYKVSCSDIRHYRVRNNMSLRSESYIRHLARPKDLIRMVLGYLRCPK